MAGDAADETVEHEGRDAGAEETVRIAGHPAADDAWARIIEQLRARGPGHTRYLHKGELARGGMGIIHLVFDQDVGRTLAMKVIRPQDDGAGRRRDAERFLEEAQITGQLDHPGIVPVHELGVDDRGQLYFTMKRVRGADLLKIWQRVFSASDPEWNETRAVATLLKVCEAMAYAHMKGVLHRDLKPSNIMVGRYGETYVMDWGLARLAGEADRRDLRLREPGAQARQAAPPSPESPLLTMEGDVLGTPAYMPPEQASGELEAVGPHSDVYAVGALLYHLLARRPPYARPGRPLSARDTLAQVQSGPPEALSTLRPDGPAELIAICNKAMARRVENRYRSMDELAQELRAWLENRVVRAHRSGPLAELRKWIARNRGVAATAAAAAAVIALLLLWFILNLKEKEQEALDLAFAAGRSERQAQAARRAALAEQERAAASAALALERAEEAEATRRQLLRVADVKRLQDLERRARDLWPATPERAEEMAEWLDEARALLARRAEHRQTLERLRGGGHPMRHPLDDESDRLVLEYRALAALDSTAERAAAARKLAEIEALERRVDLLRDYDFAGDAESLWWHDTLRDLLRALDGLGGDDPARTTVAGMADRLEAALTLEERSLGAHAAEWQDAVAAVADPALCPLYDGLEITPQLGLVPLGVDPESGLYEFWHVDSGARPERGADGRLAVGEADGMVLVLIPGGSHAAGAQAADPARPRFDPDAAVIESDREGAPVVVVLAPFFLGKHEVTQGQWRRAMGANPSFWNPVYRPDWISAAHPVEQVSWEECAELARRLDLALPSEAQWEAACRAGSDGIWQVGNDPEALARHANLKDRSYEKRFSNPGDCEAWDDGFGYHAPVGALEPNAFGFHDMHGNVWEWCLDGYGTYDRPARPGDGARGTEGDADRVCRGGGFDSRARFARSALRFGALPAARDGNLGVRLARPVRAGRP